MFSYSLNHLFSSGPNRYNSSDPSLYSLPSPTKVTSHYSGAPHGAMVDKNCRIRGITGIALPQKYVWINTHKDYVARVNDYLYGQAGSRQRNILGRRFFDIARSANMCWGPRLNSGKNSRSKLLGLRCRFLPQCWFITLPAVSAMAWKII